MKSEIADLLSAHGLVDPKATDISALIQCTQHAKYLRSELVSARECIAELRSQIISGFYEDKYPKYTQGAPTHELEEVMTAEEANGAIERIFELETKYAKLHQKYVAVCEQRDLLNDACVKYNLRMPELEAELVKLKEHMTFLGASINSDGSLCVNMPKYHKAHSDIIAAELKEE